MTVDTTSASFVSDYTYATRKYHKVMKKYQEYFNDIFRLDVASFHYTKWNETGDFLELVGSPNIQELFLETQGYSDSPYYTDIKNFRVGNVFSYTNQNISNANHNKCRRKLEEKFKINIGFAISEKYPTFCQLNCWEFYAPKEEKSLLEIQDIILMDCINNAKKLKTCFDQFKKEVLLPIANSEDLYRVNLKDIKKQNYETQKFALDNTKDTIKKALLSAGIFEKRNLMLDRIKFTPPEIRILDYYLLNMSLKEIGKETRLSYKRVENYLNTIKTKLNIKKN
jgi:DNA-binding CsgD family transcriptional regulator